MLMHFIIEGVIPPVLEHTQPAIIREEPVTAADLIQTKN